MSNADILRRWARRLLPWIVILGIAWYAMEQMYGSGKLDGERAPAVVAHLADGSRLDLSEAPGEVIVLNFWATWCAPCRAEAPELSSLHRELSSDGTGRVVGISVERTAVADAERAARRLGMKYPIGVASQSLLRQFGVQVLPTTFVIDPRGEVIRSFVGGVTEEQVLGAIR